MEVQSLRGYLLKNSKSVSFGQRLARAFPRQAQGLALTCRACLGVWACLLLMHLDRILNDATPVYVKTRRAGVRQRLLNITNKRRSLGKRVVGAGNRRALVLRLRRSCGGRVLEPRGASCRFWDAERCFV